MRDVIDLDRYPIHQPESEQYQRLVLQSQADLANTGMFNLENFMLEQVCRDLAQELTPRFAKEAFRHAREHNIYFRDKVGDLPKDHPALKKVMTVNHTLCADQLDNTALERLYSYPPFVAFIAKVMGKHELFAMADPLARFNAMSYNEGEGLNWHFDRSEFTITLLLQKPTAGGAFEYRPDLRTADEPNFEGVANLLSGTDSKLQELIVQAGTLNVFKGVNTAHRVTPVVGDLPRIIAVMAYFETPNVVFSEKERVGFYGRSA